MAGKRIINPSLIHTTFDEAITNDALALVDWIGLLEARPIPIKLLGNTYIQGSATGAVYRNTLLADDLYMRISIDGGVTWRIIYLGNLDDLHPPVTIAAGAETFISIDANQIITFIPQIEDITFDYRDIIAGTSQTYILDPKVSFPYTIESVVLETDTGTLTGVAIKINSTAVTSLSSLTVDATVDETVSTGAKTTTLGDRVYLITSIGYAGAPTSIVGKLKIKRV